MSAIRSSAASPPCDPRVLLRGDISGCDRHVRELIDEEKPMYDMYPEWGPAKHRAVTSDDATQATQAVQRAFDQRDDAAQRPDDN